MSAVPKLRFPEFDGEWEVVSIGGLGQVITGSTPSTKNNDFYGGDIPFFSPADIPDTPSVVSRSEKTLTSLGFAKTRSVRKGATLFVCIGSTIGKLAFSATEAATNQQINAVVPSGEFDDYFVFSALQRVRERVRDLSATQAVPIINKSNFSSVIVYSSSLPEQQKIASFLSSLDKKIDLLRQKKDALELYKRGLMQKIFSQEIRFKQDDGSDFPDWEEVKVGEFCTFSKGKGISKADISEDGTLPCIRYGELYTHYKVKINQVVSRTNTPAEKLVISDGGEVIIPASGEKPEDIATASVVMDKGVALGGDLNVIKTSADGYFLASYFSGEARVRLASLAQGNSVVHLYSKQIASLDISLPSLPEQQKIADFLSAMDSKIQNTSSQIEQMETFKKGLLQQMFV